jgi:hypothetical protein
MKLLVPALERGLPAKNDDATRLEKRGVAFAGKLRSIGYVLAGTKKAASPYREAAFEKNATGT